MPEALAVVKRELGADAVILGTRQLPSTGALGWARRMRVEITATRGEVASPAPRASRVQSAPPPPQPRPAAAPPPSVPEALFPHYLRLIQQDVSAELAARVVKLAASQLPPGQTPTREQCITAMRAQIAALIPQSGTSDPFPPGARRRVAFVGPAGSGKTTTIAKLAAMLKIRQKRSVALLTCDAHRLDGTSQLARYAEVLEVPVATAPNVGDVKAAIKQFENAEAILIDTPGVGPRDQARFARMASLLRAAKPDEIHLVLPASLAPSAQSRLAEGFTPLGPSHVILTHLDEIVGLGVLLNVVDRLQLGLSYLSTGQTVPQDLEKPCPGEIAKVLSDAG